MTVSDLVEAPGASDANTYCSVEAADQYHDNHPQGGVAWTAAEAAQKRRALWQATRLLDAHVVWTGYAASNGQALSWPRDGMYDRNDYGLDAGVIPPALRDATAEFARHLLDAASDRTADSAVVSSGIRELVAGSVEMKFTGDRPDVIPDAVWFLLVPSWMARVRQRSKRTAAAVPVVRT